MSVADGPGEDDALALQHVLRFAREAIEADSAEFHDSGISWGKVLEVGSKVNVLPLLGFRFHRDGRGAPPWFRRATRHAFNGVRLSNDARLTAVRDLTDACVRAGIRVAFRKGIHLAYLYPETGCRPFNDVDCFVMPRQFDELTAVLSEFGCEEASFTRAQRAFMLLATNAKPTYVLGNEGHPLDRVYFDASTRLTLPAMRAEDEGDLAALLNRSTLLDGIQVLDPVDLVFDIAISLYTGSTTLRYIHEYRFQRLNYYLDLLVVLLAFDGNDWRELSQRADALGVRDVMTFALGNLRRLYPADVASFDWPDLEDRDPSICDVVGELELSAPYIWSLNLHERFVIDKLPSDVPASASPPMPPSD